MGTTENKALVQRFYEEVWGQGNVEFVHEVFHDDYVRHHLRPTEAAPGAAGMGAIATGFRRAFPDARWHGDMIVGEDELVAARWTATGTFLGAWGAIEPPGRRAEFCGLNLFRFRDGKVAEIWNQRDDLGLMQQVGAPVFAGALASEG